MKGFLRYPSDGLADDLTILDLWEQLEHIRRHLETILGNNWRLWLSKQSAVAVTLLLETQYKAPDVTAADLATLRQAVAELDASYNFWGEGLSHKPAGALDLEESEEEPELPEMPSAGDWFVAYADTDGNPIHRAGCTFLSRYSFSRGSYRMEELIAYLKYNGFPLVMSPSRIPVFAGKIIPLEWEETAPGNRFRIIG